MCWTIVEVSIAAFFFGGGGTSNISTTWVLSRVIYCGRIACDRVISYYCKRYLFFVSEAFSMTRSSAPRPKNLAVASHAIVRWRYLMLR